jgi:hypothetical protein
VDEGLGQGRQWCRWRLMKHAHHHGWVLFCYFLLGNCTGNFHVSHAVGDVSIACHYYNLYQLCVLHLTHTCKSVHQWVWVKFFWVAFHIPTHRKNIHKTLLHPTSNHLPMLHLGGLLPFNTVCDVLPYKLTHFETTFWMYLGSHMP